MDHILTRQHPSSAFDQRQCNYVAESKLLVFPVRRQVDFNGLK